MDSSSVPPAPADPAMTPSAMRLQAYMQEHFRDLTRFWNRYTHHHNGLTIADWPKRSTRLVGSYVFDWFWVGLLLCMLAIWFIEPPTYYFRMDDPAISYPQVPQTIGSAPIVLMITLGPILIFGIAQIWIRDLRDFHQASLSAIQLFVVTQAICMLLWALVGGLRPDFLDICQPNLSGSPAFVTPNGVQWWSDKVCTCQHHELVKAKHSLPSDHAASATAVALFLVIYISAKVKIFDNKSHFWKLVLSLPFVILGLFISFSRLYDNEHSFRDIILGMIIGIVTAPIVYRLNFCSLLGPDNHIPTRYTWRGKHIQWRGRHANQDMDLPVTNPDKQTRQVTDQGVYDPNAMMYTNQMVNNFNPVTPTPVSGPAAL